MTDESRTQEESALDSACRTFGRFCSAEGRGAVSRSDGVPIERAMSLLIARAHRMRFLGAMLLVLFGAASGSVGHAAEPEFAVRAEGYLGYSSLDLLDRVDAFQGGGTGSVSLVFGELYLQGDLFGDVTDYEGGTDVSNVGPGVHFGWRDAERGSAGLVGTFGRLDIGGVELDVFRAGIEGELYFDRFSLGLNGGYTDLDGTGSAYTEITGAYYATDRARLNLRVGAQDLEDGVSFLSFGTGGEFLLTDSIAPFVRWEASVPDGFDVLLQHSLVAGVSLYWGADAPSLEAYDRTYFRPSCAGVLLVGRTC